MESFYGGRSGAPFIIVQRFDGINIPQPGDGSGVTDYTYTRDLYAIQEEYFYLPEEDGSIRQEVRFDYKIENDNLIIYDRQEKENVSSTKIPDFKIVNSIAEGGNVPLGDGRYLIKRTDANADKFLYWGPHINDGSQVNNSSYRFPIKLARGMVQCFKQGARSSSEVNYGEYVIIDTICDMNQYGNPDNGKVFRRGMDLNSGLAGAEYIGQIAGPKGDSPKLQIDKYRKITSLEHYVTTKYTADDEDLVPGSYLQGDNRIYNDDVKCAWVTLTDGFGNITGCLLGFQIPTLVQDFEATSINPYTNRVNGTTGFNSKYTNLISEDESEYEDGEWKHPFFQKWQIKVPQGYHGINSENIEIIHSWTKTPEYKADYSTGVAVPGTIEIFNDPECTDVYSTINEYSTIKSYPILGSEYVYIDDSYVNHPDFEKICGKNYIENGSEYDVNSDVISVKIAIDGGIKYVKKEDCYMDILRYKEIDFDKVQEGEVRYFYIGEHDTIDRVTISDNGILTVFYNAQPQPKELEQILKWIDTSDSKGITIDADGSVHVYYNTTHEPLGSADPYEKLDRFNRAHDHQDYENLLNWITEATLSADGRFTILYNNNTVTIGHNPDGSEIKGNRYETSLQWIDYVDFAEDGTVTFRWNTDTARTAAPAYQFERKIKYLKDVRIENTKDGGMEGTGDQKVHVTYNNDGDVDHEIGQPLNYVIEYAVALNKNDGYPRYTHPGTKDNKALYSHLLVYYSDPALRETLGNVVRNEDGDIISSDWIQYPSSKYQGHIWREWIDLGNVKGESGGIHVLKEVNDISELMDRDGHHIPPEDLIDTDSNLILGDIAAGWSCTLAHLEYKAVTSTVSNAKQIVADSAIEDNTHVRISTVNSITPGFSIGDWVRLEKSSEILFYDYDKKVWYPKSLNLEVDGIANPKNVIDKSTPIFDSAKGGYVPDETAGDAKDLKINGFWFASEIAYFAE